MPIAKKKPSAIKEKKRTQKYSNYFEPIPEPEREIARKRRREGQRHGIDLG